MFLKGAACLRKSPGLGRLFTGAPFQQRLGNLSWCSPAEGPAGREDEIMDKTVEMVFKSRVSGSGGPAHGARRGQERARGLEVSAVLERSGTGELSAVLNPSVPGQTELSEVPNTSISRVKRSCPRYRAPLSWVRQSCPRCRTPPDPGRRSCVFPRHSQDRCRGELTVTSRPCLWRGQQRQWQYSGSVRMSECSPGDQTLEERGKVR